MNRKFSFSVGEFYHIYNRGTDKRKIFIDNSDKERFLKLLFVSNATNPFVFRDFNIGETYVDFSRGTQMVAIGAYCLMPNHFHLLIKETTDNGISKFMQKLSTGYSMYFNKKHDRTGGLFQGTFKASHVDDDRYLKYLFSYIHLNPVKIINEKWKEDMAMDKKITKKYLDNYKYSSYLDYRGSKRHENLILNKEHFPEYFSTNIDFNSFLDEWIEIKNLVA